jgi:type I restriction enzyme S subunit
MPRIEVVKERLEKVPRILKRFRQSVLSAAVTGKLTEQWRGEHPEVESAEVLVKSLFKNVLKNVLHLGKSKKLIHYIKKLKPKTITIYQNHGDLLF